MYVAVYKNEVISGPSSWNSVIFGIRFGEVGIDVTVPRSPMPGDAPFVINPDAKILVCNIETPTFNDKIEYLEGPFITDVSGDIAIGHYILREKPIDAVKYVLKQEAAAERYKKEVAGTSTTIGGKEFQIDTSRGVRDMFVQKYLLMDPSDTTSWKFPHGFENISKGQLAQVVQAGAQHIQAAFDWEKAKANEIDACATLQELDQVVIREPSNDNSKSG